MYFDDLEELKTASIQIKITKTDLKRIEAMVRKFSSSKSQVCRLLILKGLKIAEQED